MAKNKQRQSIDCSYQVSSLEYNKGVDFHLKPNKIYTLVIDYPFHKGGHFLVKTGKKGMSVSGLLPRIYKAYIAQYKSAEKDPDNGYWHGIEDLVIEGMTVDHKKKTINLDVGS